MRTLAGTAATPDPVAVLGAPARIPPRPAPARRRKSWHPGCTPGGANDVKSL